jgi:hypothetical protein
MPWSLVYPQTQLYLRYTNTKQTHCPKTAVVTSQTEIERNEARSRPVVTREPVFC